MSNDLVIIGTGGHGREVLDVVGALAAAGGQWRVRGFLDDAPGLQGAEVRGLPVLGPVSWLMSHRTPPAVFLGIGSASARWRIAASLRSLDLQLPSLIHPHASVTPLATVGEGVMIAAGAIVTSNITIGAYTFLNVASSVSHDCRIGQCCNIQPGAHVLGAVTLGDGVDVGAGAVIHQNTSIGAWSIVGAGAVVLTPLPENVTAVGVPARVIKRSQPGWHRA